MENWGIGKVGVSECFISTQNQSKAMGFAMENSCCLHPSVQKSFFPSSSSSLCSSHSTYLLSSPRNVASSSKKKKNRKPIVTCMQQENLDHKDRRVFCKRRAVLFVGVSVLPLLQLRAKALQTLGKEDSGSGIRTQEQKQAAERTLQGDSSSSNPLLSLLSGLGIFSSGILGALCALAWKEKGAIEATVELMKTNLKEKEAAVISLEKNFESVLLKEKEAREKDRKKANEEQQTLMNQLKSAKSTITSLGRELQKEKTLVEELKVQLDTVQINLSRSDEDKNALERMLKEKLNSIEVLQERINLLIIEIKDKENNLQSLRSTVAEKELDYKKLSSVYECTQDELARLDSEIKRLKDELLKREKELESRNATISDLNVQISSFLIERDNSKKKLDAIQKEYSDLKLLSEEKASSDAMLLGERDQKLQNLEEQLKLALVELDKYKLLVADVTEERDSLKKTMDLEIENAKKLQQELQVTLETLDDSRNESCNLVEQLKQSRNFCSELEAEVSKVQVEFAEARKSLKRNLDDSKRSAEVLCAELASVKDVLKKTEEELQMVSHELAVDAEKRDGLQKALAEVNKKAESAVQDLKEEKKLVTSLNKELKALENQLLKDKEVQKSLEVDVEQATKSLDQMNLNAMILSNDLEAANSRISSLEDEKTLLAKSLAEQKQVSQEARENVEDAHNLVMRLGKERESLEKRAKKLEDELASAKGEILRLRSQMNSSKIVNDQNQQQSDDEGNTAVPRKKTNRRKKVVPQQSKS